MSAETRQHSPGEPERETRIQPKVVYDKGVLKPSLPYLVEVDAAKAGDLLHFIGLPDEIVEKMTIEVTNSISLMGAGGDYNPRDKIIRLKASSGWNTYKMLTQRGLLQWHVVSSRKRRALEQANKNLNNLFLHEAYHAFDIYAHYQEGELEEQNSRQSDQGCLISLGAGILTSSALGVVQMMGIRTDIACLDTPLIPLAGVATLMASGLAMRSKYYYDHPLEIMARGFVAKHESNPEWADIMRFSLK